MAKSGDFHRLGITELHAAFARGDATPSGVLDHFLRRIEALDPALRAFVEVDAKSARAAAFLSDARFAADSRRPLEGIPIAIKANLAVRGLELAAGMEARRGIVAEEDSVVVQRLRDAGAIIIGTTNMHEAALGATTDNPFFGRCVNPHGSALSPGGSSGGSAVAVAAGLCVAAIGTDTLGSIRIPAALCGIYGLKPTPGTILTAGLVPLSPRFDAIGPMARSMDDMAILTNVLCAPDLATAMRRSHFSLLAGFGGTECDPEIAEKMALIQAELPNRQGEIVVRPNCAAVRRATFILSTRDLIPTLVELGEARCARVSPEITALLERVVDRDEERLRRDRTLIDQVAQMLRREIGSNGILVTPTTPVAAFPHDTPMPETIADFTVLANVAGLPAITIPAGRNSADLPIGLQLIGPADGEAMLIAQARMLDDRIRGYAAPAGYT
ncbi:amidase [Chakrabartia godavariana]|nr:amidase [Chakrabartia godavariana]